MNIQENALPVQTGTSGSVSPTWWLVFTRELTDLWIGGKAFNLILIYSILLGVMVYVFSANSELSLIPPKEMVYETLKNAIAVSLFIGLIIGADSLSGERERATLEGLLLTPTSRRQIVLGKFLAGISPWPVAFLIAIPYMILISQRDEIIGSAIIWGAITGTILVPAYTGLGMLVSFLSSSNKTSYFVSLGIYILFLVPAQLPGTAQTGAMGQFLQWINPVAAVNHFLSKHLVNYRTLAEYGNWLISPIGFFLIVTSLIFLYAAPGLRIEGGRPSKVLKYISHLVGLSVMAGLIFFPLASPAQARHEPRLLSSGTDIQIDIDVEYLTLKTGDKLEFNTRITNHAALTSPALIVAMNVINLNKNGDVVDPEDWSPQRTQYVETLPAGESVTLGWIINTILDGDYAIYMVVLPSPAGENATSQPVASSAIHLTVTPFTRLNPGGVLPYVIGGPIIVLGIIIGLYRLRRRNIDEAGSLPQD